MCQSMRTLHKFRDVPLSARGEGLGERLSIATPPQPLPARGEGLARRVLRFRIIFPILVVAALTLLVGEVLTNYAEPTEDTKELVWPAPPEKARIKFVRTISSPNDLKLKRSSLFKRIIRKIVGIDENDSLIVSPYGVTTDSHNRIIVADAKARLIHVFDPEQKKYFNIKSPKGEMFVSLVGLAVDREDNIYVSDSYTGKIHVFDEGGKFVRRLGPDEGQFDRPTGIAIDKQRGHLYVVETRKGRVEVLNLSGQELFKFGKRGYGDGEMNFPTQICLRGDRVYVTDTLNARVQIFDLDGTFIGKIGRYGDAAGDFEKPKGVAVDSEGHIYVVEGLHDLIDIFDRDGRLLLALGGTGSGRGEFFLPTAIHIDEHDNIYVSDSYNHRVQVFKYLREAPAAGQ